MPAGPGAKNQSLDSPSMLAKLNDCPTPAVTVSSYASPDASAPVAPLVLVLTTPDLRTVNGAMFSIRTRNCDVEGSPAAIPSSESSQPAAATAIARPTVIATMLFMSSSLGVREDYAHHARRLRGYQASMAGSPDFIAATRRSSEPRIHSGEARWRSPCPASTHSNRSPSSPASERVCSSHEYQQTEGKAPSSPRVRL